MKTLRPLLWLLPLALTAAGCHPFRHFAYACHKKQAYMQASSVPALKIPAGLDAPDTTSALHLPALNEPAPPPRTGRQPCLDEPPSYKVPKPAPAPQA
ncbi:MAG TPA: hypothetical protein VNX02_11830 [Steroidobacteraceae bacterium]|jgi:hypothetical protein|nr:hypothetical protein [Steroidobacteraceae bacterium]